jgi:hypothetical protein
MVLYPALYRSILVDLSEIRSLVHGLEPELISLREFAARFEFKTRP